MSVVTFVCIEGNDVLLGLQIRPEQKNVMLKIQYRPISIGKLRVLISTLASLSQLRQLGFTEKDVDEVCHICTLLSHHSLRQFEYVCNSNAFAREMNFPHTTLLHWKVSSPKPYLLASPFFFLFYDIKY